MDTDELAWRTPNGHEGRDLGDGCIGQGMPKIASKPPEARGEEASKIIPYRCQRKYGLAD